MVASLYVYLLAQVNAPITAELRTVKLAAAVAELEKLTGVPHKLAGANPDQFIYINVKGLAASRVREGIARVARGEWKVIEGAQVLITEPWSKAIDEAYAKNATWRIEHARKRHKTLDSKKLISDYVARVHGVSTSSAIKEAHWDWTEGTPAARLLHNLLGALASKDLTQLKYGERKVFSLHPTSLQSKLPDAAGSAFSQFLAENREFSVLASANPNLAQHPNVLNQNAGFIDPDVHGVPRHLLLTAVRQATDVYLTLRVFNEKGDIVALQTQLLVSSSFDDFEGAKGELFKVIPSTTLVKLSPQETEFNEKFLQAVRSQRGKPGLKLSPDAFVAERLKNLAVNDILLKGPTEVLDQVVSSTGKNLIAKVTDANFTVLTFFSRRRELTLSSLLQEVYNSAGYEDGESLQVKNDLITLRPHPEDVGYGKGYFNRTAASTLINRARTGSVGHAEVAVLCAAHEAYDDTFLPQTFRGIFNSTGGFLLNGEDFDLLKFFGLLGQDLRESAAQSEISIPWHSLAGSQLDQARRLLLWSGQSLNGSKNLNHEVTQGLASANLAQAVVKVSLKKTSHWLLESEKFRSPLRVASPALVSGLLSPEVIKAGQGIENYDFFLGAEEVLLVTFDFGQLGKISHRLDRIELLPDSKAMKYSDLPDDFKKAVKNAVIRPEGGG